MFTDVLIYLSIPSSICWGIESLYKPLTGFPLAFGFTGTLWAFDLLPIETYEYGSINYLKTVKISIILDCLQYIFHNLAHKAWTASHAIHHEKTNPSHKDAFYTGTKDAIYQLLIPLYITICLTKPNKSTTMFFGFLYSNWLKFIHTSVKIDLGPVFITPVYHRIHHKNPTKNFGHIYKIWDKLCGTIQENP